MFDLCSSNATLIVMTTSRCFPDTPVPMALSLPKEQDAGKAIFVEALFEDREGLALGSYRFQMTHACRCLPESYLFDPMPHSVYQIAQCVISSFLTKFFCSPYAQENWDEFEQLYPQLINAHHLSALRFTPPDREAFVRDTSRRIVISRAFSGMFAFPERDNRDISSRGFNLKELFESVSAKPHTEPVN